MANGVDSDETVYYETSHLDLHCLHRYHSQNIILLACMFAGNINAQSGQGLRCKLIESTIIVKHIDETEKALIRPRLGTIFTRSASVIILIRGQ